MRTHALLVGVAAAALSLSSFAAAQPKGGPQGGPPGGGGGGGRPPMAGPPAGRPPVMAPPVSAPPVMRPPVAAPPVMTPRVNARPVTPPPMMAPRVAAPPMAGPAVGAAPIASAPVPGAMRGGGAANSNARANRQGPANANVNAIQSANPASGLGVGGTGAGRSTAGSMSSSTQGTLPTQRQGPSRANENGVTNSNENARLRSGGAGASEGMGGRGGGMMATDLSSALRQNTRILDSQGQLVARVSQVTRDTSGAVTGLTVRLADGTTRTVDVSSLAFTDGRVTTSLTGLSGFTDDAEGGRRANRQGPANANERAIERSNENAGLRSGTTGGSNGPIREGLQIRNPTDNSLLGSITGVVRDSSGQVTGVTVRLADGTTRTVSASDIVVTDGVASLNLSQLGSPPAGAESLASRLQAGAEVFDPSGRLLGRVERLVTSGGNPTSVVVQVRNGTRRLLQTVPIDSVSLAPNGAIVVRVGS